jgi:plastocyanin
MKNLRLHFITAAVLSVLAGSAMTQALVPDLFSDVHSDNPNYTAINDLKTREIISGYPDGTFQPDKVVNRVEALKIILGAAQVDVSTSTRTAPFKDISQTEWYAPYLNKAYDLGVVQGYLDGTFKPTQTVNLAENLKILLNTYKIDLTNVQVATNIFADAYGDQWYGKYLQYAKDAKMIEADASDKVYPAQGMTRGKLAEVVYRLINIREKGLDYFGQVKEVTPVPAPVVDEQLPTTVWDNVLEIKMAGSKFSVTDMLVPQGAKVRWVNDDTMNHQIVSSVSGKFSSPILKPGESYTFTFNELGTFNYYCSIHPTMTGSLTVKLPHQVPTI